MKKGKKWGRKVLLNYLLVFVLMLGGAMIGVAFALKDDSFTISGSVTFSAPNVYVGITGEVFDDSTYSLSNINWDASTSDYSSPASWENIVFNFDTYYEEVSLTINVTNYSEHSLKVSDTLTLSTRVNKTIYVDGTSVATVNKTISTNQTVVIKYVFTVADPMKAFTKDTFTLVINLDNIIENSQFV